MKWVENSYPIKWICYLRGKGMKITNTFVYLSQKRCDSVTVLSNCLRLININCHKLGMTIPCQCDSSDKGGQNE